MIHLEAKKNGLCRWISGGDLAPERRQIAHGCHRHGWFEIQRRVLRMVVNLAILNSERRG